MDLGSTVSPPLRIPVLVPRVPNYEQIEKYILEVDSNRFYTNFGPLEKRLRGTFAEIWDVSINCVRTAANATLALQGAIVTSEKANESWELPSWTFAATPLALIQAGAKFSFVDINEETWRAEFSRNTSNALDVLPLGDDLAFERLEDSSIQTFIVDGAASVAALMKKLPKSNKKYAIIISLHATKLLPAGEGAIFVSNCEKWSERFKKWTNFGFGEDRKPSLIGTNAKLSEYSSAVALASLDEFETTLSRINWAQTRALHISDSLKLQCHPALVKRIPSPYWIIKVAQGFQKNLVERTLRIQGIETRDWWGKGCHQDPIFRSLSVKLPTTERVASTTIGLPMHTFLKEDDFDFIHKVLHSIDFQH
jgi:dTDP-4-amino-4,6-dideoxygalactose transaminase